MISNPHSGTFIPPEIAATMTEAGIEKRDTDWFLARLYDFPVLQQAGMIKANLSRYVIDLNRSPDNVSLYPGKKTTGLCPGITFGELPIYFDGGKPDQDEIDKRIEHYWQPYHDQLEQELDRLIGEFGYVVLLDLHSIADVVPMLFEGSIEHFNFGTNHGKSCGPQFQTTIEDFAQSIQGYSRVVNGRFIGGYITRRYGDKNGVQAVQIELNRSTYMDEATLNWNAEKAAQVQPVLKRFVELLAQWSPGG